MSFVLKAAHSEQTLVPAVLQFGGNKAVIRIHRVVLPTSAGNFIMLIPTKTAIDSDPNQPPVPIEASQAFRGKPAGVAA